MPAQTPHTVRSYDDELHKLRAIIGQMGALCEGQLTGAIDAVVDRDEAGAHAVVALDDRMDALHAEAEAATVQVLIRYAPLADDLREVVATLKIAGWLERVGDYAKTTARRAAGLAQLDAHVPTDSVAVLASDAKQLLRTALDAYVDRDPELAARVIAEDDRIDTAYGAVYAELIAFGAATPAALVAVTHLQFIAKNLERIADQATNIAEQVRYAVLGVEAMPRSRSNAALASEPLPR